MAELLAYSKTRLTGAWTLSTPALGGTASNQKDAIDEEDTGEWLDFGQVSNNNFEVHEIDLASLPAGALITSVRVEFAYRKNSQGSFRVTPLAINADASELTYGPAESYVYGDWDTDIEIRHPYRFELEDGSLWNDHTRLGFYVKTINGENDVSDEHKLYWVRLRIQYDESGPSGTLTVPVDEASINALDTVEWTYSQLDGRPQTHYQVKIYDQSDVVDAPEGGNHLYDSGKVSSANGRSVSPNISFDAADYRVWLKVWSTSTAGGATESAWDDHDFTINTGTGLVIPEGFTATYVPSTGRVDLQIAPNIDAGNTNVEIQRSEDGGDYEIIATLPNPGWTSGSRYTVTMMDDPAMHALVVYRVRNRPTDNSPSGPWLQAAVVNTQSDYWWMIDSGDPLTRLSPRVQSYSITQRRVTSKTQLRDRAVVATTGPMADEISLTILTLDATERAELEAMLDIPRPIRLVDILGREWFVEVDSDIGKSMQRMAPLSSETTGLRDAHVFDVTLAEVAEPT